MPRSCQAKKDVISCEKPRRAAKQAKKRGYPNGETHRREEPVYAGEISSLFKVTKGSETSKYLKEKKSI